MTKLSVCVLILLTAAARLSAADRPDTFVSKTHGFSITVPADNAPTPTYQLAIFFLPASDGFAPNVNVQRQYYEKTLEDYERLSTSQFKALKFAVTQRRLNRGVLTYEYSGTSQGKKMHWHSRAFKKGKYVYLVTATALESQWQSNRKQLIASVNSFKLDR